MKDQEVDIEQRFTTKRGTELMPLEALQAGIHTLYAMLRISAQLDEGKQADEGGEVKPVTAKTLTENDRMIYGCAASGGASPCRYDLHNPPMHPKDCLAPVPFTEWRHKTTGDRATVLYTTGPGGLKRTIEWPKWAIDCIPPGHLVVVFIVLDEEDPSQEWTTLGRFLELFEEVTP